MTLTNRNWILVRKYQNSFAQILKEYPFLELIYDSSESFLKLLQFSSEQENKFLLIDQNMVELKVALGHQQKSVRFIFIDEKPSDEEVLNTLESLVRRISNLEEINKKMIKEVETAFTEFGRKLKFSFINPDKSQIEQSEDNKLAKKIGQNNVWKGVIGDASIFKQGKTFFEVEVESSTGSSNIMIGYVKKGESDANGYYTKATGHMFYLCNGYFYRSSSGSVVLQSIRGKKGDKIRCVFDTKEWKIQYYYNGQKAGNPQDCTIGKGDISEICPCIDLYDITDSIKIL